MSKAKPKRSGRQSRPAGAASKPRSSGIKRGKNRAPAIPEVKSDKGSRRVGGPTTSRATASKPARSKPPTKARASVFTRRKPRAAAQTAPRQARRQEDVPTPTTPPKVITGIAVKADEAQPNELQSKPPVPSTVEPAGPKADDKDHARPSAFVETLGTRFSSPLSRVMRTNAEIHHLMTTRAVATVRFATSLARCRSPLDLWAAHIRLISDFLGPRPPRRG